MLNLNHVGKTFGRDVVALRDLNLGIGAHEFVTLLGPSGCGKSTALRLAAGLISPTEGEVTREGDLDIGFVFQEPTLLPWARVRRNVELPLRLKGLGKWERESRVEGALQMVGLEEFARAWPRELSGGMKMRVSIARALVTRPDVLMMDEPFAALDEMTRFRLNDDLLDLWAAGKWTVMFVTHSVFEAVYLSQRILIMAARPGHVVEAIDIDAPMPRGPGHRTSAAYAEACRHVQERMAAIHGPASRES